MRNHKAIRSIVAVGVGMGLAMGSLGCSFIKRDAARYSKDTTALLETRNASLKECYDGVLKDDSKAAGTVVITFKVKSETGALHDVKVVDDKSTAPDSVRQCVANAVDGLALKPPDATDGHATFTYEFEIAPQKTAEPVSSDFKADAPAS